MRVLCADCGHREAMPKHVAKLALETKQDPKCPRCKSANLTVDAPGQDGRRRVTRGGEEVGYVETYRRPGTDLEGGVREWRYVRNDGAESISVHGPEDAVNRLARRRYASDPKDPEMVYGPESGYWEAEDEMYREQYENQNLRMLSDEEADEFDRGWEQHRQERDAYDEYVQEFMGKSPEDLGRSARRRNVRGRRVARRVAMKRQAVEAGVPQVWIASLSDYNNGDMVGKWVDATSIESLEDGVQEVLALSKQPDAEEYAIHDYDNFGPFADELGEYPDLEQVAVIGSLIEQHGDVAIAAGEWLGTADPYDIEQAIDEGYYGEFASMREVAENLVDDIGAENLNNPEAYFDYASWGEEAISELESYEDEDDPDPVLEDFRENYGGRDYASWAANYIDDLGGISQLGEGALRDYFDFDDLARDLEYDGWYMGLNGHVFRDY